MAIGDHKTCAQSARLFSISPKSLSTTALAMPTEGVMLDLSHLGCLISTSTFMPIGTAITIGIEGLGRREAIISRVHGTTWGCCFVEPLSGAELALALGSPCLATWSASASPAMAELGTEPVRRDNVIRATFGRARR